MERSLKPSHAKVKDYYNALNQFGQFNMSHETAVRQGFERFGVTDDSNRSDDKEYILRIVGQMITVNLEAVKTVNALPDLGLSGINKAKPAGATQ